MMVVPRSKLLLWASIVVLACTGLVALGPTKSTPAVGLLAAFVILVVRDAIISKSRLSGIHIMLPEVVRTSMGHEGEISVRIENDRMEVRRLRLGLAFPKEIHTPTYDLSAELPTEEPSSSILWPIKPLKRGSYILDKCYLETASLLGLWSIRAAVKAHAEIRVYPELFNEGKRLTGLFLNRGLGIHAQRQVGKGRDFEQLREYFPGDSFEDIHWKATAKRGQPITKVFQIERTQQIYVIIDSSRLSARRIGRFSNGQVGEPGEDTSSLKTALERFITGALVMALAAERQGDLFGLVTFDDRIRAFVRARSGKAHYGVCRDALFMLQPRRVSPDYAELFTFVGSKIRRRALLIFLTQLDDPVLAESFTRNVDLICRKHLVLVNMLKPAQARPLFSSASISSVDEIYSHLGGHLLWRELRETGKVFQRQGVGFSLLDNEEICTELISQYLTLKRRQLL